MNIRSDFAIFESVTNTLSKQIKAEMVQGKCKNITDKCRFFRCLFVLLLGKWIPGI